MQTLLGYTAEQAGLALMPGGFTIMLAASSRISFIPLHPALASLIRPHHAFFLVVPYGRFRPRHRLPNRGHGPCLSSGWHGVPFRAHQHRCLRLSSRDKNNAASGLMNLARNIGGSVGISLVTTMLDRRTQVHINDLSRNLSASNPAFPSMFRELPRRCALTVPAPPSPPSRPMP